MKRVDQVLPALVYGDAIGNHTMEIRCMLRERGIASTIYAQYIDPRYAHAAKSIDALEDEPNRVLIYHFSIGSPVTKKLLTFTHSTLAVYYHNITPAKFFDGVNPQLAAELRMGRDQLQLLTRAPIAIAASEFNRREMIEAGFADVQVAHYLVDFARLDAGARGAEAKRIRARYKDDRFTIAFVGRVAPNKCQHDLIHLVNYYRTLIDRSVRLLLVGQRRWQLGWLHSVRRHRGYVERHDGLLNYWWWLWHGLSRCSGYLGEIFLHRLLYCCFHKRTVLREQARVWRVVLLFA